MITAAVAYQGARISIDIATPAVVSDDAVQARDTLGWLATGLELGTVLAAVLVWVAMQRLEWDTKIGVGATIGLALAIIAFSMVIGVLQSLALAAAVVWLSMLCLALYKAFAPQRR